MCRRSGLEIKRRCGWLGVAGLSGPPVWARKHIAVHSCPKSYIAAESLALVEDFFVRRSLGPTNFEALSAKQVEAFVILERELAEERNHGQHTTRQVV